MLFFLFGQNPGSGGGSSTNPIMTFLPLILIFAVFYFLMIMPQQKKQKQHQQLLNTLDKGDRVITSSGIHGTIANVKDHTIILVIADGVKVEMDKGHIAVKVNQGRETESSDKTVSSR